MLSLAKLVAEMRKLNPGGEFLTDFNQPKYFDFIVEAARMLGGDHGNASWNKPAVVIKPGHDLSKLAEIKRGRALKSGNTMEEKDAQSFKTLLQQEWGLKLASSARNTLRERKYNKGQKLHKTADLMKLTKHINQILQSALQELSKDVNDQSYRR